MAKPVMAANRTMFYVGFKHRGLTFLLRNVEVAPSFAPVEQSGILFCPLYTKDDAAIKIIEIYQLGFDDDIDLKLIRDTDIVEELCAYEFRYTTNYGIDRALIYKAA